MFPYLLFKQRSLWFTSVPYSIRFLLILVSLHIYINVTFPSTTATEFPFQRFRCQNIDFSFIQIVFHFFLLISSYLGTRKRINLGLGSSWFALLIRSRISGVRNIIQFEPIQSSSEWKEPKLTSGGNFGHSLAYIKKFEDLT